jgi:Mitochondrial domain of unknown function (DUF1713)
MTGGRPKSLMTGNYLCLLRSDRLRGRRGTPPTTPVLSSAIAAPTLSGAMGSLIKKRRKRMRKKKHKKLLRRTRHQRRARGK